MNKSRNIIFRVTEEEYKLIKSKAASYGSMSSMILDCIRSGTTGKKQIYRLDNLEDWVDKYNTFKIDISHLCGNINQLSRYVNKMNKIGIINSSFMNEYNKLLNTVNYKLELIIDNNKNIEKKFREALK